MDALETFRAGAVIPAHPLALTEDLRIDERRQRALSRYYLASGAGGLAVGVHTTQFALHTSHRELYEPVLALAADELRDARGRVAIAGVCGPVEQAVAEARTAARLGYHAVLLAPYGADGATEDELVARAATVGEVLPVVGFALQPAVGGRVHSRAFWTRLADIPSVIGIKVAPFDRYRTIDVFTGVARSSRAADVVCYTGNDDHIIGDLLGRFPGAKGDVRFAGGLLGQWSVWTSKAVAILGMARSARTGDAQDRAALEALEAPLTDANSAIFDVAGGFAGSIAGIHEVLRRQGLLDAVRCLDPRERLSPGQAEEIDRVLASYPALGDDGFVAEHLDRWLD